jgi:hypothetical protein
LRSLRRSIVTEQTAGTAEMLAKRGPEPRVGRPAVHMIGYGLADDLRYRAPVDRCDRRQIVS